MGEIFDEFIPELRLKFPTHIALQDLGSASLLATRGGSNRGFLIVSTTLDDRQGVTESA
jgi:hypothetical protein